MLWREAGVEMVESGARRVQALLVQRLGAAGQGLPEMIASVGLRLPHPLVEQLRGIASAYERLTAASDFELDDAVRFEQACGMAAAAIADVAAAGESAPEATDSARVGEPAAGPARLRFGRGRARHVAMEPAGGLCAALIVLALGWTVVAFALRSPGEPGAAPQDPLDTGQARALSGPAPAEARTATTVLDVQLSRTSRAQLQALLAGRGERFTTSDGHFGGTVVRSTAKASDVDGVHTVDYHFARDARLVGVVMTMEPRFDEIVEILKAKHRLIERARDEAGNSVAHFKTPDARIQVSEPHLRAQMTVQYLRDDFHAALVAEHAAQRRRSATREAAKL